MTSEALDGFGRALIERVRDTPISQWRQIIQGLSKAERCQRIHAEIIAQGLDEDYLCDQLVPQVVDTVIHHLLSMLEEEWLQLSANVNGHQIDSVNEISDGLAGEIYTEEGWISRFSKFPAVGFDDD